MIDLLRNAYIKSGTSNFSSFDGRSKIDYIAARGFMLNQVHYFNRELLEQCKAEIAKYLRERVTDKDCIVANSILENITTIDDIETLDIVIAALGASDFIKNDDVDAALNFEIVGESDCHYLTTYAINYARRVSDSNYLNEFMQKMNMILSKICFLVKTENIAFYTKQK